MSKRGYKRLPNSVQDRQIADSPTLSPYSGLWSFQLATSFVTEIPPYWSPARDIWLRNFYKKPGNDLLAGTISTVISKVETTGWYVEGPERMANMYQRILMRESEFGAGYSIFCQKAVLPYLTQDNGMWIERRRTGETDREGAALGFANFDSAQIVPSADPAYPAWFLDDEGQYHKLHFSQVGHIVDMPSDDHKMNNVGYCALSRAAMTARILMMIAKYKYERLSDLPPAGLLILNNLTEGQWKDMQDKYTAGEMNKNNSTWRNIMVAFGLDPSLKAEASLFEFSRLPEHFDEAKATEIAVYSFALAFNIDPGDVWPRSNTPLGTASEANISHLKAKGKRVGSIYADFERFFNDGFSLPKTCLFAFDYKDTDEDAQAAEIANLRAQLIRKLWEPPANAKLGFGTTPATPDEGAPNPETQEGIITRDEARAMAVLSGIAPDWLLKTNATQMSISDTGIEKSGIDMGPRSRVYRNGIVLRLEHRPQVWNGFIHKALTTDAVIKALKNA